MQFYNDLLYAPGLLEIKHLKVLTVLIGPKALSGDKYYSFATKHLEQFLFVIYGLDSYCPVVTVTSQYLDQPFFPFQKRLSCLYLLTYFHNLVQYASHIMQTSEHATNSEAAAKVYSPSR